MPRHILEPLGDPTIHRLEEVSPIALFTPEELRRAEENGELDPDANLLDLRPDPAHFVRYIKSLDRVDLSSEFFVRLLEAYREIKAERDGDPMRYELDSSVYARVTDFLPRTLLYLQLILQIQTHMSSEGYTSGNIFSKPEHILSFVKHALDAGTAAPPQPSHSRSAKKPGLKMDDLRIVDEDEEDDFEDGGDSDDETPGLEGVPPDEEMTATAMNLLLSILEGTLCQPNSLKLSPVSHVHESQSRPFREHFTHLGRHPSPRRRALKTSFGGSPSARPRSTDGVDGQTGVHLNSFTFQATTKIR